MQKRDFLIQITLSLVVGKKSKFDDHKILLSHLALTLAEKLELLRFAKGYHLQQGVIYAIMLFFPLFFFITPCTAWITPYLMAWATPTATNSTAILALQKRATRYTANIPHITPTEHAFRICSIDPSTYIQESRILRCFHFWSLAFRQFLSTLVSLQFHNKCFKRRSDPTRFLPTFLHIL